MINDELSEVQRLQKRVAELEQENHFLHQIINLVPGCVYWKNRKGIYLGGNDATAQVLGYKVGKDIAGKTITELSNKVFAAQIDTTDNRIMQTGVAETLEEKTFHLDGSSNIYLSYKAPLRDFEGNICGLMGVSVEISHFKNIEKALIIAKEDAEAADRAKSEFLRNMSHDLRTPFNGILSFSEQLLKIETDPRKKDMLQYILVSTRHLISIVDEILEFSKIEFSQLPLVENKINLRTIAQDLQKMFSTALTERNIEFHITCSPRLPQWLMGDQVRVLRILLNLIGNAVKFTTVGAIKLGIDVERELENALLISMNVKDTGIGIPKEQFDFIFGKFNRLSPSDKSLYEGLGLGLYIVKKFVGELNGKIQVSSKVGEGSTFTCYLPMRAARITDQAIDE